MERMKRLNTIKTKEYNPTKDELQDGGTVKVPSY